jgi:Flp pilus assembly protein TadD
MAPDAPFIYDALGRVYLQMGRYDEALTACQRATILGGDDPGAYSSLGLVYASSGRENEARWVARTLEQLSGRKYVSPYYIAAIYGTLGDKEQAFVWLQKASAEHSALLLIINLDPSFDKLRSDARYTALVKPIQLG